MSFKVLANIHLSAPGGNRNYKCAPPCPALHGFWGFELRSLYLLHSPSGLPRPLWAILALFSVFIRPSPFWGLCLDSLNKLGCGEVEIPSRIKNADGELGIQPKGGDCVYHAGHLSRFSRFFLSKTYFLHPFLPTLSWLPPFSLLWDQQGALPESPGLAPTHCHPLPLPLSLAQLCFLLPPHSPVSPFTPFPPLR